MEEIAKFVKKLSSVVADYGKSLSKAAKDAQKGSKSVDQELGYAPRARCRTCR